MTLRALTPREEQLAQLADLHTRYSIDHAADAPPAPERKDGGLWNLDFHSPPELEAEFMAEARQIMGLDTPPPVVGKEAVYREFPTG